LAAAVKVHETNSKTDATGKLIFYPSLNASVVVAAAAAAAANEARMKFI